MSSKFFTMTAASLAMMAGLGNAAFAQESEAASQLPGVLEALNLSDVEVEDGRRGGRKIEGDLPDGGEIVAIVDENNKVLMIKGDDAALPQSVLDELLPQAVRDNQILTQFAVIDRIGGHDGRAMVAGQDADGERLRAGFDPEGRLMRFGRGDEDHGPRDHHKRDHHKRGHDKHEKRGDKHERRGDHDGKPRHGKDRAMERIDAEAIGQKLGDAGYSELGQPRPAGPRIVLDAVNPAGEAVTLDLDREGEVLRETAR